MIKIGKQTDHLNFTKLDSGRNGFELKRINGTKESSFIFKTNDISESIDDLDTGDEDDDLLDLE